MATWAWVSAKSSEKHRVRPPAVDHNFESSKTQAKMKYVSFGCHTRGATREGNLLEAYAALKVRQARCCVIRHTQKTTCLLRIDGSAKHECPDLPRVTCGVNQMCIAGALLGMRSVSASSNTACTQYGIYAESTARS